MTWLAKLLVTKWFARKHAHVQPLSPYLPEVGSRFVFFSADYNTTFHMLLSCCSFSYSASAAREYGMKLFPLALGP